MGKVIFVISMSADGFINAANETIDVPMGEGGLKLHDWAMGTDDPRDREMLTKGASTLGAVIAGRRTYDTSIKSWGADGPTGSLRIPLVVVSHSTPDNIPANGVYQFANSIEAAMAQAMSIAGDKDISVMGGADIARQLIQAGMVDEIQIHLVPVLFGSGTRLFNAPDSPHIQLEKIDAVSTDAATHLRFRVVK